MATILRAVALGLLVIATTMHAVGFCTNAWISANLDKRGIQNIISANGMANVSMSDNVGLSINMGLWKFCLKIELGLDNIPGAEGTTGGMNMCHTAEAALIPDWMKAVQALGILSMLTAVVGILLMVYSFVGDSKGDRARLLPIILSCVSLLAGVLLLIGTVVYAAEYTEMMKQLKDQMSAMGSADPSLSQLYENVAEHTGLGYSFALEVVAGVLMVVVTLIIAGPSLVRSVAGGSPHNLAV